MKKQELLNLIDENLLDKLFGFCYARTKNSHESAELCSDIVFALVKLANTEGEISNPHPFIWQVARNVYADFSENRRRHDSVFFGGDSDEIISSLADTADEDNGEAIIAIYRRIAFLTKAYREVMILYYLEGKRTAEIARLQNTSEGAIRQRLFSAREKIKSEVKSMNNNKPIALDRVDFCLNGTGNPDWSDPRGTLERQFSMQVLRLCMEKPRTAYEIAQELNVPTVYVEEELEILKNGTNGKYGVLRRLDSGKYALNIILLSKEKMQEAFDIYRKHIPKLVPQMISYLKEHKEEYLSFPYLNKRVEPSAAYWRNINTIPYVVCRAVHAILSQKYFADMEYVTQPFCVYGHEYIDGIAYLGCDGICAKNLFGYSSVLIYNLYFQPTGDSRVPLMQKRFGCAHNISLDIPLQLAIRAVRGIEINSLSEEELEAASRAISQGYIYREGDMLYTKILVSNNGDENNIDIINCKFLECVDKEVLISIADEMYRFIKENVPDYLMYQWGHVNFLANNPVLEELIVSCFECGLISPPADGTAENCYMIVEK